MEKYREIHQRVKDFAPGSASALDCIDLLDRLYAVRHDLVDQMIKHDWSDNKDVERPIGQVLLMAGVPNEVIQGMEKKIIPDSVTGQTLKSFFRMTPDNYKISGHLIEFIEVTVTADVAKGIREKKMKYESGLMYIENLLETEYKRGNVGFLYKISFNVVAVKTDGSNISTQWPSRRNEGVVQQMRLVQADINYVREHLIKHDERASLEAMFNLKFHISGPKLRYFSIPEYRPQALCYPTIDNLLNYCRGWLTTDHDFVFKEVTGSNVDIHFNNNEKMHLSHYTESRKPRNFLLIQLSIQGVYLPSTISSDQCDTRIGCLEISKNSPETPVQALASDIAYKYLSLTRDEIINYYNPKIHFQPTQNVKEPGTLKIGLSQLNPMAKAVIENVGKHKSEKGIFGEIIESINIASQIQQNNCAKIVEQILANLEMNAGEISTSVPSPRKTTGVDELLGKFYDNEIGKYLLQVVRKTVAWHIGHMVRDITESLIAHSGLKRSKYWSVHAYDHGNVILFILPSKSLEVVGSYIRFFTVFKDGVGLIDSDNLDSKVDIDGVTWCFSKVMSLDLNRLLALNISFEKSLLATATWFQYYTEDQGHFPLQHALRSVFAFHFLLCISQKMKLCALFDNLRYLIPSVTSLYSGYELLIDKFFERPFKSALDVYIYSITKSLLISLAQNNKVRFYSKVRLLGLTVDQSTVGASGVYPSLMSRVVYKHYRSLISEATTCFFLFEKGLHGNLSEEAKIHLETIEWARKFHDKEQRYGDTLMREGYVIDSVLAGEVKIEQQLFCQEVVELSAQELNKYLQAKSQVLCSNIMNKHWDKPYFSQTRNISLKGMSGSLQEDGHLAASVTLIEAIRFLNRSQTNPNVIDMYEQTKQHKAQARIVRKYQRTEADRGFFITTLPTRVRLEIIEDYFDAIAKVVPEEYISYGGDRKILNIQQALEKALRWASGISEITMSTGKAIRFKRKLMYVSADATKWSPGDNSAKFKRFTQAIYDGLSDDKLKCCVVDALRNIYETEFFMSRKLHRYIDNMEEYSEAVRDFVSFFAGGVSATVKGNWLQGNLNKCSSLFGAAVSLLFRRVWQELFPELDCFFEFAHHSDDALFIYGYLEPEDDGTDWFMYVSQQIQAGNFHWHAVNQEMWKSMFNLHEHLLLMGSIKVSPKKTTVSPTNAEFLSTFFEGCAVSIPFVKILLGSLSDLPGLGFFDDLAAAQSRCVKALDLGACPQLSQLAIVLCTSKVERLYGTADGMVNSPVSFLKVDKSHIPIPLGGDGSMSIMELATAGIGMADKNILKNAYYSYKHTRREGDKYVLGLFKFLMSLSEDVYQHDRLGEFSFVGKVQWKVFTPKSEFEFYDQYSSTFLSTWTKQHPVYDYIIPRGRDNLLVYLVRKLNDPSIVTAMTMQSPLQLRFRMQAKQHMKVCKLDGEWVTFREVLASADSYATAYQPTSRDLDLFNTLVSCTFSKEYAWKDFLNEVRCEVVTTRHIHRSKVARTFTVREKDQAIQNPITSVIGYKYASTVDEISDVLDSAFFPDSLSADLQVMKEGVYRELGLDIGLPDVLKRIAPLLYKAGRSRIVIVEGNVEGTAESICSYWLKSMSLIKTIKVKPKKEVLKAVSLYNQRDNLGLQDDLAATRLCIEVWRWCKANEQDVKEWFNALYFEKQTLMDWVERFRRKGVVPVDPEIQCVGLLLYDVLGYKTVLQLQANRRAYSGKQYDAYCVQTYNEETKLYEGDLRVTFNFGLDCARLEIFWNKKEYILETSITQRHVLKLMMEEVSQELVRCGMRFKTEQVNHTKSLVLFKTESGFEWGKPNVPCIVFKHCVLRTGLRTKQPINKEFMITIQSDGFRAIAQMDLESPRFLLAHAYHTLRNVRYQAVQAVGNVWFKTEQHKLFINPIISSGLLENFMKGLPAAIPPAAYSLIMNKAKISVDLFMFNELLALINKENILNLDGITETSEGYSTVTSMSSRQWSEEVSIMSDDGIDDQEDFTISLDDINFEQIDLEEDIQHFLQDESAYVGDLLIQTEEVEVKKIRGVTRVLEPVKLIKSWVSKGLAIDKVYNPVGIILMTRYMSKNYNFSITPLALLNPYDLTEFESVVKGWGETVNDRFVELDLEAQRLVREKGIQPEDILPDSLFSFRHVDILLRRLFPRDPVSSFY
ncbi:RNA-dependent RNA polymerase [Orthohantavirus delgaditoense]|uniref:RNA-directed RNA polymerase L n=1 Tax=Orthohantavirus delgaditoense TaxID=3052476 RepID=K9JA45_9VIRU|nr:RNA-dependent RNA polymerase [Orthohantavirus delgaditoense]ADE06644.1 RNA-dependent RNA polymerase [Orthohantavirus delgaditoense]